MAERRVHVSSPMYNPSINYNSDLFGTKSSYNTEYNCGSRHDTQYPYTEQDHLALRQLALKNFVRPMTLDGRTVHTPVEEIQYSCDCNLDSSLWASKFNSEALKYEVKNGVLKRGCDCLKRNGLQDQCPRVRHQGRWQCMTNTPHLCTTKSPPMRSLYDNHLQRQERPLQSDPPDHDTSQRLPHKDMTLPAMHDNRSYSNYSRTKETTNTGCKIC